MLTRLKNINTKIDRNDELVFKVNLLQKQSTENCTNEGNKVYQHLYPNTNGG